MVTEKKYFSSNAERNFEKHKVISKCKNDKP